MNTQDQAPACHLSWTVTRVSKAFYTVAATTNGSEYDFVGNFFSLSDAHRAGRLYAKQLIHRVRGRQCSAVHVA